MTICDFHVQLEFDSFSFKQHFFFNVVSLFNKPLVNLLTILKGKVLSFKYEEWSIKYAKGWRVKYIQLKTKNKNRSMFENVFKSCN